MSNYFIKTYMHTAFQKIKMFKRKKKVKRLLSYTLPPGGRLKQMPQNAAGAGS